MKKDINQLAAHILEQATNPKPSDKNPHAVALGRLGGLKGGKARAKALTAAQRKSISKKAIETRYKNKKTV
jgi:hypothetical protein